MPVRLIQITDLHLFADPDAELRGVCPRARFENILAALKPERAGADRLIITGDLTHDDRRETYAALRELLADWIDMLRVIPGNHDERTAMRDVFDDRVQVAAGRNVFSDEIGGWQLIGLDTHLSGSVAGRAGDEQLEWLAAQLQAAADRPTLLCLHHPPVAIGSRWLDEVGLEDAAELSAILARHPHVRLVCCGHVHQELAIGGGGFNVLTTPATAVQFRPGAESLEIDGAAPGYRVIELEDDGAWRSRVVRVAAG
jgi:Icc protein